MNINNIPENISKVTVIIPTFGRSISLKRAIESVLLQTYESVDLIVVDDNHQGSKARENTSNLMQEYSNNKRVTYIQHEKNMNGSAARNTGIEYSNSKYLAFLDDDDWYSENHFEHLVQFLESNDDFGAVYSGWKRGDLISNKIKSGKLTKELLLMDYEPITPSLLFKKDVITSLNGFDSSFFRHQDYELMIRFFRENKVGSVRYNTTNLGQNEGENTLKGNDLEQLKIQYLSKFENDINQIDKEIKGFKNSVYSVHYMRVLISYIKEDKFSDAFRIFNCYFLVHPYQFSKNLFKIIQRRIVK